MTKVHGESKRDKILLLTQVLPYPPNSGGKIKTWNLIRYLSRNYRITLVSFIRSDAELKHLPQLWSYCEDIKTVILKRSRIRDIFFFLFSLFTGTPFLILRDRSPAMRKLVRKTLQAGEFDLLHVVQLNMAQYADEVSEIPKILDQENCVSVILERMLRLEKSPFRKLVGLIEWRKLRRYEGEICKKFDEVHAVTEVDKRALHELTGNESRVNIIPIGIDCELKRPIARAENARDIMSMGVMYYPPNSDGVLWFAKEVYPLIKRELAHVRFYVLGVRPPAEIIKLGKSDRDILVKGYVNDVTPYIAGCAVFVVPLRVGGGLRVKILDAFAWGIPVVSTAVGCEGLKVIPNRDLMVADDPQDFAGAVIEVIQNKDLARRLSENGRRLVEKNYDWRIAYGGLDAVYGRYCRNAEMKMGEAGL